MAVGPTEVFSHVFFQMPPEQRSITVEANAIIISFMEGAKNAKVSSNGAIPPVSHSPRVQDIGLGSFIDLEA